MVLYPGWTKSSDYITTTEKFGTGPIQASQLTEAMNRIAISSMPKLTREQAFLAKTMGVNLPFINKFTRKEKQLLAQMLLGGRNPSSIDHLALDWLKHVDGKDFFQNCLFIYGKRLTKER
jgi:hypothetical protein